MRPYKILVHNPLDLFDITTYLPFLIRLIFNVYYNHVVAVIVLEGKRFVIHAQKRGVIMEGYDRWVINGPNRKIKVEDMDSNLSDAQLQKNAILAIGAGYDLPSYPSIIWRRFTGKWRGKTGEQAAELMHCFETVARMEGKKDFYLAIPIK